MKDFWTTLVAGFVIFLGALGLIILFTILFSFPIMWLWNWLMPTIFAIKQITFWQAFGMNVLTGVLFKSSFKITPNNAGSGQPHSW